MTAPEISADGFTYGRGNQVLNTPYARMRRQISDSLAAPKPDPGQPVSPGIANPYGVGITAYEPNTTPFAVATPTDQPGADVAKSTVDMPQGNRDSTDQLNKQLADALAKPPQVDYAAGGLTDATGRVQAFVQAALSAASRHVPYVWGGTSLQFGADCSGLIYAAAKAAGIDWKRYVAADYGRMPTVTPDSARPGDIVYWAPGQNGVGPTGHVGIYLGNGQMVVAPQSGQNVQVERVFGTPTYHRIFTDNGFGVVATPTGGTTYNYNGRAYQAPAPAPFVAVSGGLGGTMRAL